MDVRAGAAVQHHGLVVLVQVIFDLFSKKKSYLTVGAAPARGECESPQRQAPGGGGQSKPTGGAGVASSFSLPSYPPPQL